MRSWLWIIFAVLSALPWIFLRLAGFHGQPVLVAALSGVAILTAAFLLSWASEVVQLDISQALAVVILSFIAVLPEYSVNAYIVWRAGQDPAYSAYAIANMTGANRLLIGVGWAAVVLVFWLRSRAQTVTLGSEETLELSALVLATLYAFFIPLKGSLSALDAVVLIAIFAAYAYRTSVQPPEEPELVGPALAIGSLSTSLRRLVTLSLFVFAAAVILVSAEPFADGPVESGRLLNIDEFVLIQWLAPLASEAPEFIVAVLFALRGSPHLGLRTMISSKVNQWTVLIGMLPLIYAVSAGQLSPLTLDARQTEEVFLTAAQSAFAVVLIAALALSVRDVLFLGVLFLIQFVFPETRLVVAVLYLLLAFGLAAFDRKRLRGLLRSSRTLVSGQ